MHKLKLNGKVDQLTIRTIVSIIETATYNLARHLGKLFSSLSMSKYTIDSTKHFMEKIKQETVPDGYKMVCFFWSQVIFYERVFRKKTIDITI